MKAADILARVKKDKVKRSKVERWFDAHPEEAKVMREVISMADAEGISRRSAVPAAQAELGGPPANYPSVVKWYDQGVAEDGK